MKNRHIYIIITALIASCAILGTEYTSAKHVKACSGVVNKIEFVCQGKLWKCIQFTDKDGSLVKCFGKAVKPEPGHDTDPGANPNPNPL